MIRRAAVVVPAANEESSIGACLAALSAAALVAPGPVRIVVVLDACTDDTAAVVATYPDVETVTTSTRNVGQARRLGATQALRDEDPAELLLTSTDADSLVPLDWFGRMLQLASSADLVLGTVRPDTGLRPPIERAWFAQHRLTEGHPHVHAANLGIRAGAYLALGGWRALPSGEDVDLASRAVQAGLRIRRTASIPVRTSTRAIGRAPEGFSSYLRALGHT